MVTHVWRMERFVWVALGAGGLLCGAGLGSRLRGEESPPVGADLEGCVPTGVYVASACPVGPGGRGDGPRCLRQLWQCELNLVLAHPAPPHRRVAAGLRSRPGPAMRGTTERWQRRPEDRIERTGREPFALDADLAVLCLAGNEQALTRLYQHCRRLARAAGPPFGWRPARRDREHVLDTEDLAGGFYCRLVGHPPRLASYRPDRGTLAAWLELVFTDYLIDCHRCRQRHEPPAVSVETALTALEELSRSAGDPVLDSCLRSADCLRVRSLVRRLPFRQREVVVRHVFREQSHARIARDLGLKTAAVQKRWERARDCLKRIAGPPPW